MSNIGSYEERIKNFSWSISEKELGYKDGDVINIGWYCSDRICLTGKADKLALRYEDYLGRKKEYTISTRPSKLLLKLVKNMEYLE